jgi:general secretion pathway protein G
MKPQRNTQGFTLLELLVVLVILALLAGIAVPTYFGRAEAARLQKVEADFGLIATALSVYKLDNRQLPTTAQGLAALVQRPTLPPEPASYKPSGYLRELPLDPWNQPYLYLSPARDGNKEYDLFSYGADGQRGGEGQDADLQF